MSIDTVPMTTIFFLSLRMLGYLLETVALVLNMKSLRQPLPAQLTSLMDEATWQRMQAYTRAKHRLELLESTTGMVVLVLFWLLGGFNLLQHTVGSWELGPISSGIAYVGILMVLSYWASLPFTLYRVFGVEARFGFNRTTAATFVADQLKVFLLAIILGGPLLAGILVVFQQAESFAWLYGWLATSLFGLGLQMILPRWILPLFNRFSPLADGELRRAILAYAHTIQFPVTDIFEIDGSRRSSKANAFISGFGKNRRIALFDTLIQQHTVAELVAVLAHEIGHSRKRHIPKMVFLGILRLGLLFWLLSFALQWPSLYQGFLMETTPLYAGLVFFNLLFEPLNLLFALFFNKISRQFEFEADRFAVTTAPEPESLASALKTLAKENLTNMTPHPFYVMIHYSHPPLLARLAAIPAPKAS